LRRGGRIRYQGRPFIARPWSLNVCGGLKRVSSARKRKKKRGKLLHAACERGGGLLLKGRALPQGPGEVRENGEQKKGFLDDE